MQPATDERRTKEGARVPLDLWIRLAHEDYEEPFDADGVDLSTGGLALRADYLPEVGDRLRCQFESPPTGEEIQVDGEVVWAHDAGERSGEFGLRFGPLDDQVQNSLREIVSHVRGDTSNLARLHLDGVASPIEAEILERDARWLTVEQELPFLNLGMGVTIEGGGGAPRGRLVSVDLRLDGGTPRLVLSVELDELDGFAAETGAAVSEDTFDDDERIEVGAAETLDHELDEEPLAYDGLDASDSTVQDYELEGELRDAVDAHVPIERDDVVVFAVGEDDERDDELARPSIEDDEDARSAGDRLGAFRAKVEPLVAKTRAGFGAALGKARPALSAGWAKLAALYALALSKAGPGAKALSVKVKARFSKLVSRRAKRRKTSAPPAKRVAGAPRRQRRAAAPPAPKRNRRKILALSTLAFLGVGTGAYALSGSDEATAASEPSSELPPAMTAPTASIAQPPPAVEPAPTASAPATPETAPAPAVEAPTPAPEGGRLGEPSFPTLRDADPSSAPVSEGQAFGAASVAEGRSATIRMSQPVETLRGQPQDGGFTVTVPGALALDRAGPIAAANPSVERAMILNRGDHAVLTVRFVAGRSPDYRVVARGRAIEVVIGR